MSLTRSMFFKWAAAGAVPATGVRISTAVLLSPARLQWAAAGAQTGTGVVITLAATTEPWEFVPVLTDGSSFIEGWES